MIVTDWIPRENFTLWYELFKKSKGRFLCNPIDDGKRVHIKYEFTDMDSYKKMMESFRRLTTPIKETKRGLCKNGYRRRS